MLAFTKVSLLLQWALLSVIATATPSHEQDFQLLQWNPHWQCFLWDEHGCSANAQQTLTQLLVLGSIDFANIVELAAKDYLLPEGFEKLEQVCGVDSTALIYNKLRWRPSADVVGGASGCMSRNDRPFVVQQFDMVEADMGDRDGNSDITVRKVVVVGAHYPHTRQRYYLRKALTEVVAATGVESVILLADTNEFRYVKSDHLLKDISCPGAYATSSDLMRTCCFNDGFAFMHTYDRIVANFGSITDTVMFLDDLPDWARTGEMHKPILATLKARSHVAISARIWRVFITGVAAAAVGMIITLIFILNL